MRIVVLCPHFAPDTAPTGTVMTRIVHELVTLGYEVHVVTALPWYRAHRIEPEWRGGVGRTEWPAWGSITRVHPFPGSDKRNLSRRALGFAGFSVLAGLAGVRAGGWFRKVDVVLAMSPPLTLGLTGWLVGLSHRAPLVFNIQDVFPDAAVRTGALTNRRLIRLAEWLERISYRRAAAVTVLSDDLAANVRGKLASRRSGSDPALGEIGGDRDGSGSDPVHVIPNFVDTDVIRPGDRMTAYRAELGIGAEPVVLYAGNVGFSQSLDLLLAAARELPDVAFVVNGDGAARSELEQAAADLPNVRFAGYQPAERLSEVLATGDVHVVPLRAGLGNVSVPSKTYSSLAAARPVVAAIDPGTEIPRLLAAAGAGVDVPPDDPSVFVAALRALLADPARQGELGRAGREWVVRAASPAAVGGAYDRLLRAVAGGPAARRSGAGRR